MYVLSRSACRLELEAHFSLPSFCAGLRQIAQAMGRQDLRLAQGQPVRLKASSISFTLTSLTLVLVRLDRINWFRGRSSQVKPYKRPYVPTVRKGSRPSRPGRPNRPSSSKSKPSTSDYDDERKRLRARQAGDDEDEEDERGDTGVTGDDDDFDTVREELAEEREEEAEAEAEAEADGKFGIGNTMIDDDGSNVKDQDDGYVDFVSSSSTSTSSGAKASATGSSAKEVDDEDHEDGEEQNELLKEEDYDLTPTTLEAGPTKASPLTAKPNAVSSFPRRSRCFRRFNKLTLTPYSSPSSTFLCKSLTPRLSTSERMGNASSSVSSHFHLSSPFAPPSRRSMLTWLLLVTPR